ncbi:NUDIX hydrolase [Kytococcus sedentarius]|uniref:NUDIX hydrolase n=1 Tax=Kytococcus sedentarius TaxID=1276 RepID=UPI0035BBD708
MTQTYHRPDPTGLVPLFVRVAEHLLAVGHGVDPTWLARELEAPAREGAVPTADHGPVDDAGNRPLVLDYTDGYDPADLPVPAAPGMVVEAEVAQRRQRVATHAVVFDPSGERVLLTGLWDALSETEFWNWPGGGVDPGETFAEALAREVWEETGHDLLEAVPLAVRSWTGTGRRQDGVEEDYHGVSLVWAARVAVAHEPVVHDADGSTTQAAWVALDDPRVSDRIERNADDLRRARAAMGG